MDKRLYVNRLQECLEPAANENNAVPMKKYMKNHFEFLGIKSPERKVLLSKFLKDHGLPDPGSVDSVIRLLWTLPQREYQYCAMVIADKSIKKADKDFLYTIEYMLLNKSWWDTVDYVAGSLAGRFFRKFPEYLPGKTNAWSESDNMWLNRSAILFQLGYKTATNTDLMSRYILNHNKSKEFFIQKAIGWGLRQFSKTDPDWVRNFISKHQLAPLSIREGLKWLDK